MPDERFLRALERLDAANAEDPRSETWQGRAYPKEGLYARRMTARLERFAPGASEAVRLAARAQHIRRWEIPREAFPRDRAGYHRWRTRLQAHHAEVAGALLREVGYDEDTIERVGRLLRKRQLRTDPEAQLLEDVACLVFLEHSLVDFAAGQERSKVVDILRRTWGKMSPAGQRAALALELPPAARALVDEALGA